METAPQLLEQLSQLDDGQRLRFYESLAMNLTVVNRTIWDDERLGSEAKVHQLKCVNEIMHRVVAAIPIVRERPREWYDEIMFGEVRHWLSQDRSIAGSVGWAIQQSLVRARRQDESKGSSEPDQREG